MGTHGDLDLHNKVEALKRAHLFGKESDKEGWIPDCASIKVTKARLEMACHLRYSHFHNISEHF